MKTKQPFQIRQGDVWVEEIQALPKGLKIKRDNVIIHSDSTMHDHSLKNGKVYVDKQGNLYLEAPKATQVVHTEDHKPLSLPKGVYKIIRQRQLLAKDMTSVVID